jgi:hypothetical protein
MKAGEKKSKWRSNQRKKHDSGVCMCSFVFIILRIAKEPTDTQMSTNTSEKQPNLNLLFLGKGQEAAWHVENV